MLCPRRSAMNDRTLLGPWVRRFLLEYLVTERNLSHNTQCSYRDALILLIPFVADKLNKSVDRLAVLDLSADMVRLFFLDLDGRSVKIRGKGRKERHCPLWASTTEELKDLVANRLPTDFVFLNRCGHPTTRFGIYALVKRYAIKLRVQMPSLD